MNETVLTSNSASNSREIAAPRLTRLQRLGRSVLLKVLSGVREGCVELIEKSGQQTFGVEAAGLPIVRVCVEDNRFYQQVAFGGGLGAAESYLQGQWECDDLTALIRILIRNIDATDGLSGGLQWISEFAERWGHWFSRNTRAGSQKNIHAHYDLGNDFFSLFLDDTMTYSSGIFATADSTMEEASILKIDRMCRLLDLQPNDRVIEIGTGWGSFAIHAAQNYGCHITTTTISKEQFAFAQARVQEKKLTDKIELKLCDYRDLEGQYDKLASIEMIEAVGKKFLETYFRKCSSLLKPDGMMALQSITMNEQRYQLYANSVDFIQKYIFPGGFLPSVNTIGSAVGKVTDMRVMQFDDFAEHYARTLNNWRDRFYAVKDDVVSRFDERFFRTWDYYFCYCEAAFLERYCGVSQFAFAKPLCRHDHVPSNVEEVCV